MAAIDAVLARLNPDQRLAVTTTEGPVLVLAGAGSGKTRVITCRIAWLLARGVAPRNVLAMTFTNKAAGEMRERVSELVGPDRARELTVGTFHAFCARLLREHAKAAGIAPNFAICDASDQLAALKGALRDLRIAEASIQPSVLQSRISLMKNRLIASESFLAGAGDDQDELIGRAWQRYEEHLKRARLLDFDDLLLFALRLLRDDKKVRTALAERYRYVMVDEYQDTNAPQYEIVKAIAGAHKNLCVVGDDDQSIYGWRGADVQKILGFEKDFKGALVVRLETNYRSTEPILAAANKVIQQNPKRHEKTLRSALGPGDAVATYRFEDEIAEADSVAREILDLTHRGKAKLSDFAVLFRTASQPRAFEAQFRARAIPYVLVGGMSFFDRKEVRDVLAYVRLAVHAKDEVSFLRVINCPPRGVGKTSIDRALEFATTHGISACDAFERSSEIEDLSPAAADAVHSFRAKLAGFARTDPGRGLVPWLSELIEAVDYRSEVDRCYPDAKAREDRWSSVMEILDMAENHVRRTEKPTLTNFLEALTLSTIEEEPSLDRKREAVTLMTLHAAKGLEFPRVYLVGVEEGLLPHARSIAEDGVEEERRLMYVGITRAQRMLTVTCTKTRSKYGARVVTIPSRFLYEMRGEAPPKDWGGAVAERSRPRASSKAKARKRTRR